MAAATFEAIHNKALSPIIKYLDSIECIVVGGARATADIILPQNALSLAYNVLFQQVIYHAHAI